MKLHCVVLEGEQRAALERVVAVGTSHARSVTHARILLKADQGPSGPAWTDEDIARALDVSRSTVERVRHRFANQGHAAALRAYRPYLRPPGKLDGAAEAKVVMLACSPPPPGRARWTLRLLARQLVELEVVESVSYETVRTTLKKTRSSHG
jgi:transposase